MQTEAKLKQLMAVMLGVAEDMIHEDFSMDDAESWDSLRHMNMILAIEDEFKVSIPDEEVGNLTSYKLIKLVLDDLVGK